MSPIILSITIIAYFMILFAISYIAGHKADNEGFFVGNRKSAWYIVAFAMIGSTISGVTFVSVPGMVQASGFSYLQMVLGFIVGQFIIAFILVPLFYRMNLVSIYDILKIASELLPIRQEPGFSLFPKCSELPCGSF